MGIEQLKEGFARNCVFVKVNKHIDSKIRNKLRLIYKAMQLSALLSTMFSTGNLHRSKTVVWVQGHEGSHANILESYVVHLAPETSSIVNVVLWDKKHLLLFHLSSRTSTRRVGRSPCRPVCTLSCRRLQRWSLPARFLTCWVRWNITPWFIFSIYSSKEGS